MLICDCLPWIPLCSSLLVPSFYSLFCLIDSAPTRPLPEVLPLPPQTPPCLHCRILHLRSLHCWVLTLAPPLHAAETSVSKVMSNLWLLKSSLYFHSLSQ